MVWVLVHCVQVLSSRSPKTRLAQAVAAWGDGWYGFNLDGVAEAAARIAFLGAQCAESGRDRGELRITVALRDPQINDAAALADLGVDELVIVEGPPEDAELAADWVSAVAAHWAPALS